MPPGDVTRLVNVATNDPKHEVVPITVRMVIQDVPASDDVLLLPQSIDLGRVKSTGLDPAMLVRVVIPGMKGEQLGDVRVGPASSMLEITRQETHVDTAPNGSASRIVQYRLSWKRVPISGPISEKIRFFIAGGHKDGSEIDFYIRGDVIAAMSPSNAQ